MLVGLHAFARRAPPQRAGEGLRRSAGGGGGSSQQYTWQVWMKNTSLLIIYRVLWCLMRIYNDIHICIIYIFCFPATGHRHPASGAGIRHRQPASGNRHRHPAPGIRHRQPVRHPATGIRHHRHRASGTRHRHPVSASGTGIHAATGTPAPGTRHPAAIASASSTGHRHRYRQPTPAPDIWHQQFPENRCRHIDQK